MTGAVEAAGDGPREALALMGEVMARRPHKDDHALTEISKALCAERDRIIAGHRRSPPDAAGRDGLERLNAVIAQVFSLHFPLGPIPWDDFDKARGWLADLLAEPRRA